MKILKTMFSKLASASTEIIYCYNVGNNKYFVPRLKSTCEERKSKVYVVLFDSSGSMGNAYLKGLHEFCNKLGSDDIVHLFTFGEDNFYGKYTRDTLLGHWCGKRTRTYLTKSLMQLTPILLKLISEGPVEMLTISDGNLDDEVTAKPLIHSLFEQIMLSGNSFNLTSMCFCYGNKADSFMANIAASCAGEIITIPNDDEKALCKAICESMDTKPHIVKSSIPNLTCSIGIPCTDTLSTRSGFFVEGDISEILVDGVPHILEVREFQSIDEENCKLMLDLLEKIIINILLAKDVKQIEGCKTVLTFLSKTFKTCGFKSIILKDIPVKRFNRLGTMLETLSNQEKIGKMNAAQRSEFMQGNLCGNAGKRALKLLDGKHPLKIIWDEVKTALQNNIEKELEESKQKNVKKELVQDLQLSTNYENLAALLELVEKISPEEIEIDVFLACIGFVGYGLTLPIDEKTGKPYPITANAFDFPIIKKISLAMPISTCDIINAFKQGSELHEFQNKMHIFNACVPNPSDPSMLIWNKHLKQTRNIILSCFVSPIAVNMPWLYEAYIAAVARYLLSIEKPTILEADLLRNICENLKWPSKKWKGIAEKSALPNPVFYGDDGSPLQVFAYLIAQEKISEEQEKISEKQLKALLFLIIYTNIRDACNYKGFNKPQIRNGMMQIELPNSFDSVCTPLDETRLNKYVSQFDSFFPDKTLWSNITSKSFMEKFLEFVRNMIIQAMLCNDENDFVNKITGKPNIEFGESSIPQICAIRQQIFANAQKPMIAEKERRDTVLELLKEGITLPDFHGKFPKISSVDYPERELFENQLVGSEIPPNIKSQIALFLLLGTDNEGHRCKMSRLQGILQAVLTPEDSVIYRAHPNFNLDNLLPAGSKVLGSYLSGKIFERMESGSKRKSRWNYEPQYKKP